MLLLLLLVMPVLLVGVLSTSLTLLLLLLVLVTGGMMLINKGKAGSRHALVYEHCQQLLISGPASAPATLAFFLLLQRKETHDTSAVMASHKCNNSDSER